MCRAVDAESPAASSKRAQTSVDMSINHAYEECFDNAASKGDDHAESRGEIQQKVTDISSSAPETSGADIDDLSSSILSKQALCSYPNSFLPQIDELLEPTNTSLLDCGGFGLLEQGIQHPEEHGSFSDAIHREIDNPWVEQSTGLNGMVGNLDVHQLGSQPFDRALNLTHFAMPTPFKNSISFLDSEFDSSPTISEL